MFQKTLQKLTLLNSIVFLLIFTLFSLAIYGYLSFRLFDRLDDAMVMRAQTLRIANGRITMQQRVRSLFDPRMFLVVRGMGGEMINLFPQRNEETGNVTELVSKVSGLGIQNIDFEDHVYRVLSMPYPHEDRTISVEGRITAIRDVVVVSIVDSEFELLRRLKWIIFGGLVGGMIVIVLAGYYLAKRAMIPIQQSWDKQQQFVADASHELRSPLTVIQSNAELVLRRPQNTVETESPRITNILREAMRMNRLISSLLTLARADADKAELVITAFSLSEIVETVAAQYQPLAELNGIQLEVDVPDQLEMMGDRERIQQLLIIVLDNALKYTTQGKIIIACAKMDKNVMLSVEDTGCGIPPGDVPRIFDRFFRGDKARSRETGGTGLGLAIAKWIVDTHGGKIMAESQVGIGTKVKIILPGKQAAS